MALHCGWPVSALALLSTMMFACEGSPMIEPSADAFAWASSTAVRLSLQKVPMNILEGDFATMLEVTTTAILQHASRVPRHSSFVEVFSGAAGTAKALSAMGYTVYTFDRSDFCWQNMCCLTGCLYCLWLIASVRPGGVVHYAPQCSTWIGLSRYHTRRSRMDPAGCHDLRVDTHEANWTSMIMSPGQLQRNHYTAHGTDRGRGTTTRRRK